MENDHTTTVVVPEETPEQVEARTRRYAQVSKQLQCPYEEYSEEWYRYVHPGFPDEFYPIFVKYSEEQREKNKDQE